MSVAGLDGRVPNADATTLVRTTDGTRVRPAGVAVTFAIRAAGGVHAGGAIYAGGADRAAGAVRTAGAFAVQRRNGSSITPAACNHGAEAR